MTRIVIDFVCNFQLNRIRRYHRKINNIVLSDIISWLNQGLMEYEAQLSEYNNYWRRFKCGEGCNQ